MLPAFLLSDRIDREICHFYKVSGFIPMCVLYFLSEASVMPPKDAASFKIQIKKHQHFGRGSSLSLSLVLSLFHPVFLCFSLSHTIPLWLSTNSPKLQVGPCLQHRSG